MTSLDLNVLLENVVTVVEANSECYAECGFVDIDGNPYTPTALSYGIKSLTYNTDVAPEWQLWSGQLSNEIVIVIPANLNAPLGNVRMEMRQLTLQIIAPGGSIRYDKRVYNIMQIRQVP